MIRAEAQHAKGENMKPPHAHIRSLPPKGAIASLGAALQEAI